MTNDVDLIQKPSVLESHDCIQGWTNSGSAKQVSLISVTRENKDEPLCSSSPFGVMDDGWNTFGTWAFFTTFYKIYIIVSTLAQNDMCFAGQTCPKPNFMKKLQIMFNFQQFVMVETVTTALMDRFPRIRHYKLLTVVACCTIFFLLGLTLTTNVSIYKARKQNIG